MLLILVLRRALMWWKHWGQQELSSGSQASGLLWHAGWSEVAREVLELAPAA